MKADLTRPQWEAIQMLLCGHSEVGGHIPPSELCYRASTEISKQLGIEKWDGFKKWSKEKSLFKR